MKKKEEPHVSDAISEFLRDRPNNEKVRCKDCNTLMRRVGRTIAWCPHCKKNVVI